jgi:nucleotide-binding universal stress UspA family protein
MLGADGRRTTMKRIVIATDGSSGAADALEAGYELASRLDLEVIVVYARHSPLGFLGDPYYQDAVTEEGHHARAVIADAKLHATRFDVEPEYVVVEGSPAEAILEIADARDADLIVVGPRGLGRIAGTLLGSVSRDIINGADVPVLVAKTRAAVAAR